MTKSEIREHLHTINLFAKRVLENAPEEADCTAEENEVFAELANYMNAYKNLHPLQPSNPGCETCYFRGRERSDEPCWKCKYGIHHGIKNMYIFQEKEK